MSRQTDDRLRNDMLDAFGDLRQFLKRISFASSFDENAFGVYDSIQQAVANIIDGL